MAATMHREKKFSRMELDRLNIVKIWWSRLCIQGKSEPSLWCGDVMRLRLLKKINAPLKGKLARRDPTIFSKGKSQANYEDVTLPENQPADLGEIEQPEPLQFCVSSYFAMNDGIDEPHNMDLPQDHHQAHVADITQCELYDSYQADAGQFERFDIEGDDGTQVNFPFHGHTDIRTSLVDEAQIHDEDDEHGDENPGDEDDEHDDNEDDEHDDEQMMKNDTYGFELHRLDLFGCQYDHEEENSLGSHRPLHRIGDWHDLLDAAADDEIHQQHPGDHANHQSDEGDDGTQVNFPLHGHTDIRTSLVDEAQIRRLFVWMVTELQAVNVADNEIHKQHPGDHANHQSDDGLINAQDSPQRQTRTRKALIRDKQTKIPSEMYKSWLQDTSDILRKRKHLSITRSTKMVRLVEHLSITRFTKMARLVDLPPVALSRPLLSTQPSGKTWSPHSPDRNGYDGQIRSAFEEVHSGVGSGSLGASSVELQGTSLKLPSVPSENLMEELRSNLMNRVDALTQVEKLTDPLRRQLKKHFDTDETTSVDQLAYGLNRNKAANLFYQTCVLASKDFIRVKQEASYENIFIHRGRTYTRDDDCFRFNELHRV